MKFPIGLRLFLAIVASIAIAGGFGLALTRWNLLDPTPGHPLVNGRARESALADALAMAYRDHGDWSFLPAGADARKNWLRDWVHARLADDASAAAEAPELEHRLGLLDAQHRLIAGAIPGPLVIASASVDTFQRPIEVGGKTVGYLIEARPQDAGDALAVAFLVDQQRNLAFAALGALSIGAFVAAMLAAHFRRPIRQLVQGSRRLGEGRFDTRLSLRRGDELGELASAFDGLAARLEEAERTRKQWVADTSHELRTPLAVLRGQIEALRDGVRAATPEHLAVLQRQVDMLTGLVDTLFDLARADEGRLACEELPADVWQLVVESLDAFGTRLHAAGLSARIVDVPARATVRGDAARLRQVLSNLFENALRYTDAGGHIEIRGEAVGGELRIDVDDSEPGVDPAALARLGERFFRVDASRARATGGAGLGLALSRRLVEAHGGRLTFAASPLGGLRASLALPLEGDLG